MNKPLSLEQKKAFSRGEVKITESGVTTIEESYLTGKHPESDLLVMVDESMDLSPEAAAQKVALESIPAAIELSDEQETFIDSVLNSETDECVLLLGKAGTGKSTCTRELFRRADQLGKSYIRCAPTGVAAINIGGETVHRIINLLKRHRQAVIDFIALDEVSMCRADLMDELDASLRYVMLSDKPFGGIKVALIGDPGQLPPVVKEPAEKKYLEVNYHSCHFFAAYAFAKAKWNVIELTKIFRQKDERFPKLLNLVRVGDSEKPIAWLNKYRSVTEAKGVVLCPTNARAGYINDMEIQKVKGDWIEYRCVREGDVQDRDFPVDPLIRIKVGAKVMIVRNVYRDTGRRDEDGVPITRLDLINGDVGTVTDASPEHLTILCTRTGLEHTIGQQDGIWQKEKTTYDEKTKRMTREQVGFFMQMPVRLAYAITIHKSQGATIEELTVDLTNRMFEAGQCYVALSRGVSLDSLYILGKLRPSDVITSPQVQDFLKHKLQSQFVGVKKGSHFDVAEIEPEEKKAAQDSAFEEMF